MGVPCSISKPKQVDFKCETDFKTLITKSVGTVGTVNDVLSLQKKVQSNLAIRNGLIRNKLVLRNHFPWTICHLLQKERIFWH